MRVIQHIFHTIIITDDNQPKRSNYLVQYSAIIPGIGLKIGEIRAKGKLNENDAKEGVLTFLEKNFPLAVSICITTVKKEA